MDKTVKLTEAQNFFLNIANKEKRARDYFKSYNLYADDVSFQETYNLTPKEAYKIISRFFDIIRSQNQYYHIQINSTLKSKDIDTILKKAGKQGLQKALIRIDNMDCANKPINWCIAYFMNIPQQI